MEEKKIGVLSIVSLVMGVLAVIVGFLAIIGVPVFITIIAAIAAITTGIIALVKKEKPAMPVIGIVISVISVILAIVLCVFFLIGKGIGEYEKYSGRNSSSSEYSYGDLLNSLNSYASNTQYNYTNSYDYLKNTLANSTNTLANATNTLANTTNSIYSNTTTNTTTSSTTEEKKVSGGKRVGNLDKAGGFVTVPDNWQKFIDVDAPGVFQYAYANVYIVTLNATDSKGISAETYANAMKSNLENQGVKNITTETASIGGYTAQKIRGYYANDNVWIDIYYFTKNDGKLQYISIEGPDTASDYFKIPSTFSQIQ